MKNVLVVSKNLEFCKEINNNICENAKIINISTSYEESIRNVILTRPDIIIFEIEIQYYKVVNLMKEISRLEYYQPMLMLINSVCLCDIEKKYTNCVVIKEKSNNFLRLYKILKYIENNDLVIEDLDNRILQEMQKIGFNMKNKGDYMIFNVIKSIKTHNNLGTNLEKEIYPYISKCTGIPEKQIKWNINYSINSVYETKPRSICKYLNIEYYEKPTSKYIIFTLLNNV